MWNCVYITEEIKRGNKSFSAAQCDEINIYKSVILLLLG